MKYRYLKVGDEIPRNAEIKLRSESDDKWEVTIRPIPYLTDYLNNYLVYRVPVEERLNDEQAPEG